MVDNKVLGAILTVFIVVILAAGAFIPEISNQQAKMTTKYSVVDESHNLSNPACLVDGTVNISNSNCNLTIDNVFTGWRVTGCPIGSVVVGNATTDLTVTTDYTTSATGVQLKNTTATENNGETLLVDYDYCDEGYNVDSGSRGVSRLINLFAVLALLGVVVGVALRERFF